MIYIQPEPLTKEAFAPFGDVIEFRGEFVPNNQGRCKKFPALGFIESKNSQIINTHLYVQPEAISRPFRLALLERHPKGCQMFMPINKEPYYIVVAPGNDAPDVENIRCFTAEHGQGVIYHAGVWHHPLLALRDNAQFLVADPANVGPNLHEFCLPENASIYVR